MAINTTAIVALAKEHGWKMTKTATENEPHWKPNRADAGAYFDLPTHIITFTRGDAVATMPVTPHASIPDALRYVRGNRKLGQMLGTDGKPVLLPALAEQLSVKPKVKRAAKPKTAKAS